MDLGNIFRRFFGFSQDPRDRFSSEDSNEELYGNGYKRRNPSDPFYGQNHGFPPTDERDFSGIEGMFEHFHKDLFRQFEGLHRQMEDMMKDFGQIDFPTEFQPPSSETPQEPKEDGQDGSRVFIWSSPPSPFFRQGADMPERKARNPRDYMLKHDEEAEQHVAPPRTTPSQPSQPLPLDKGKDEPKIDEPFSFPPWNKQGRNKEDSDLDGKLSDEQMLALIKKPSQQPPVERRSFERPGFFSGSSFSFSSVRGADGKTEHKKMVRDSSGHEETTVTRSLGDKTHTVTTIKGRDGAEERKETLSNMNQGDLPKFEEQWNSPGRATIQDPTAPMLSKPSIEMQDRDLFSKLFGWGKR